MILSSNSLSHNRNHYSTQCGRFNFSQGMTRCHATTALNDLWQTTRSPAHEACSAWFATTEPERITAGICEPQPARPAMRRRVPLTPFCGGGRTQKRKMRCIARSSLGSENYFCHGGKRKSYRAINHHMRQRVRDFLQRRHHVSGRGARTFDHESIFGELVGYTILGACDERAVETGLGLPRHRSTLLRGVQRAVLIQTTQANLWIPATPSRPMPAARRQ
jgi:hypothetical protein